MTDRALSLLGLALRGNNLAVGEEPVADACKTHRAKLVLTAADAAGNSADRARRWADAGNVPWIQVPWDKAALGFALGRSTCAMAALTDLGLAQAVAGRLAQGDPERYGEMTEKLRLKAERAAQRREKTARERQQRGGGKRPPVKYRKK